MSRWRQDSNEVSYYYKYSLIEINGGIQYKVLKSLWEIMTLMVEAVTSTANGCYIKFKQWYLKSNFNI